MNRFVTKNEQRPAYRPLFVFSYVIIQIKYYIITKLFSVSNMYLDKNFG